MLHSLLTTGKYRVQGFGAFRVCNLQIRFQQVSAKFTSSST